MFCCHAVPLAKDLLLTQGEIHMRMSFRNLLAVMAVTVIAAHPLFAVPVSATVIDPGMGIGVFALLGVTILSIRGPVKP